MIPMSRLVNLVRRFSSTKMQLEVGDRIPAGSFMNIELLTEGCAIGRPQKLEASSGNISQLL